MTNATYKAFDNKVRPFSALAAMGRLLKNKEDTSQVFRIIAALDGPRLESGFQAWKGTPEGQALLEDRPNLRETLMRHEWLAAMPEGSLGKEYHDFITQEGLSADGLQVEMDRSGESFESAGEDRKYFSYRMRHTHDLFHLLTGYGRDAVGELSVLTFTTNQAGGLGGGKRYRSRGIGLITFLGKRKWTKSFPDIPVGACIREAKELGQAITTPLALVRWEDRLGEQVSDLREEFGIGRPELYLSVKDKMKDLDSDYRDELARLHREKEEREGNAALAA